MFEQLPATPDHGEIESTILKKWDTEKTFDSVRTKNEGGPKFSFTDGPVTANKSLAVHTAWGRTLKDVFQRYKALGGFEQRYQNGFDCQGLWIEVGVEKELGLNSKREIEEYGLAAFARHCRSVVERSAEELRAGSIRLGQWMDWDRSYFTFSDTNIEYIWRFLQICHERDWLFRGHRATEWCSRCGTSISAHELVGSYIDKTDPAIKVRFPLVDRPGEAVVIWTTTPWTLPANVAAAVNPESTYGLLGGDWVAVDTVEGGEFSQTVKGSEMVGWAYVPPFADMEGASSAPRTVVPWDEVSMTDGTGIVHIAPGCGGEDFELGKALDLPVIQPVDEAGNYYPEFGELAGQNTADVADWVIDSLESRGLLAERSTIDHRVPECWRCHTPLIFKVSDDWFIAVDEIRDPMRKANAEVEWTPEYMGKRMDDWLVNMGDWNISRRRYYGLPLPFYPCSCGHTTVLGSKQELAEKAIGNLDGLEELRRPWIDDVAIRCDGCGEPVDRVLEVGDVWLDAGIVPFSTLGWNRDEYTAEGYATGAAKGLTKADLPDHAYWEEWFPADWVSEMREQIRLWFYSQLFMSVALTGRAPYKKVLGYEKMLDETGREMHGSWGNQISATDAFEKMGADVMRWQFTRQPPSQDLLFGFGPAQEIKRKLLTLWNSASFFTQYAAIAGFAPSYDRLTGEPRSDHPLDRWMEARTSKLVRDAESAYEGYLANDALAAAEAYVEDLSNWYIRRSRRRFWDGEPAALETLWRALTAVVRVVAPVTPFLAEHLWEKLVLAACDDAPDSVFLAGWVVAPPADDELVAEMAAARTVVELGRRARSDVKMRTRQPLARMVVEGSEPFDRFVDEVTNELRIDEVAHGTVEATEVVVRPNLPVLGPRLGPEVGKIKASLAAGNYDELPDGGYRVEGHDLSADDVLVERAVRDGWSVASADGVTVAIDLTLDESLLKRGRVNDLVHEINGARKDAGFELTDRIELTLVASDADLEEHFDWIAAEVLATSLAVDSTGELAEPSVTAIK